MRFVIPTYRVAIALSTLTALFSAAPLSAEPIAVRQMEGQIHGFLALKTLSGAILANCDLEQSTRGAEVISRLSCHFRDGSLQDETTVFSQNGHFRMHSYHLIQKGAAFKHPMDVAFNASGEVTVHYVDDGKDKSSTTQVELPPDLANGMVPILLKNLAPGTQSATVSMLVATPKPMIVKLAISPDGEDAFTTAGAAQKAIRYLIKVEIGGVKGVIAPLVGKQPPDTHVWMLGGSAPAFVKSEGPFFEGGPLWRMELVSPVWSRTVTSTRPAKGTATRKK